MLPSVPATRVAANVIRRILVTWSFETPPNNWTANSTGIDTRTMMSGVSREANSLPSTSCWLVSWVRSNRMRVRLSFSCATALAAPKADRKTSRANCRGPRIWKNVAPKLARSPGL